VNRWTGDFGAPVLPRASASLPAPSTPALRVSTPTNPAPRTQPLPPAGSRPAAQAAPKLVSPGPMSGGNCPGGKCGVPAPVFGSDSGYGSSVPAPRSGVTVNPPLPSAPAPYVAPRTGQPAYVAPAPVPYRAPVIIRRPARRVGDCST
jgi:hypothetical protein